MTSRPVTDPPADAHPAGPFNLAMLDLRPVHRLASALLRAAGERALAFDSLNQVHASAVQRAHHGGGAFVDRVLDALDIRLDVAESELQRIPRSGPLVVVANHPFGGIDGLALAAILRRVRPDVKLLANHLLASVPELRDSLLFVDPFGASGSIARNSAALRAATRWLKSGGVIGIFPAGEVSHLHLRRRRICDGQWSDLPARLAMMADAPVLPIYFDGRNSLLFQLGGLLHPRLRTILLPRELIHRRGSTVAARIGSTVSARRLRGFNSPQTATAHLRMRTYLLHGRGQRDALPATRSAPAPAAIASPEEPQQMQHELWRLPPARCLASAGAMQVWYGTMREMPTIVREIGRLREMAFRPVGEGTGRERDLDDFDRHYLHLLVWHAQKREVIGAYRMGLTDEVLTTRGSRGLYTSTLFRYRAALLRQISPAIELGRSFVRPEYQKDYAPLMLLWRGIGSFVAQRPRYRRLLGAVSISNEYSSLSKQILMAFLRASNYLPALGRLLSPRNPPRLRPPRQLEAELAATVAGSAEQVDELLAEIESGRRMPVLLRQYLKLGAKLLAFNVDPAFGDALDGLMLVDLLNVDPALLGRFMGSDNVERFYAHHYSALHS